MKLHKNAALTVAQRKKVKALFEKGTPVAALATQFNVHQTTIRRWIKRDSPLDKTVATRQKRVVTAAYEQAVLAYRQAHPTAGPIPIALALQAEFACAHRGTVTLILQRAGLTRKTTARAKPKWRIPVGRHRLQGDVQQLPAIQGQRGFEYKISFIHLATRWKYSEIHADCTSQTIAAVYQRALDALPPFS
jgi:transposase